MDNGLGMEGCHITPRWPRPPPVPFVPVSSLWQEVGQWFSVTPEHLAWGPARSRIGIHIVVVKPLEGDCTWLTQLARQVGVGSSGSRDMWDSWGQVGSRCSAFPRHCFTQFLLELRDSCSGLRYVRKCRCCRDWGSSLEDRLQSGKDV